MKRQPLPHPKGTFWVTLDRWGTVKLWTGPKPTRDTRTRRGPHQGTWHQGYDKDGLPERYTHQFEFCERTFRILTGIKLGKTTVHLYRLEKAP